jgi:hypothetical protein
MGVCAKTVPTDAGAAIAASAVVIMVLRSIMAQFLLVIACSARNDNNLFRANVPLNKPL